jgi:hypothetical protein
MRIPPLREWSDDTLWIVFGITLTLVVCVVVMLTMPPT